VGYPQAFPRLRSQAWQQNARHLFGRLEARNQKSEIRSQKSEIRSQKSGSFVG
jgi:hypothetical protein